MTARLRPIVAILAVGVAAPLFPHSANDGFPHRAHAGLFPTCTGCHAGIESDATPAYPDPEDCRSCHDGERRARVEWAGPTSRTSNLRFSHTEHRRASSAADMDVGCERCHVRAGESDRMAVQEAGPEACRACHDEARGHLDEGSPCMRCHRPLVEVTAPGASWVESLPRPPDHAEPAFLETHGPGPAAATARCAVCHARESCARCHPDAPSVAAIQALEPDPRVAALAEGRPPEYPRPASHADALWRWGHGDEASASCGSCHTRTSCAVCHRGGEEPSIAGLPASGEGRGPGVRLAAGIRAHPPGFDAEHAVEGAAADSRCSTCHEQAECAACHDDPQAGFHLDNFVQRHGMEAYLEAPECTSCHNTEIFCRGCHDGAGLASGSGADRLFHDARSDWLLTHGQAARQGLEGCVACHSQADCSRCHSSVGGWGINPHGPAFDPGRMRQRTLVMCLRCHSRESLGGG